jgi:hypothetical protein
LSWGQAFYFAFHYLKKSFTFGIFALSHSSWQESSARRDSPCTLRAV